jgi:hypothetical protein
MFRISWVLRRQLALGPAPLYVHNLEFLEGEGVVSVLSLCSEDEAPPPFGLAHRFHFMRCVLPDHKAHRAPLPTEIQLAFDALVKLLECGCVYVHCQAGVERSPLICMAWLMYNRGLSLIDALDYLKSVHPWTGPLPNQLASLRLWYANPSKNCSSANYGPASC